MGIMACDPPWCPLIRSCRRSNCKTREDSHDFSHTLYPRHQKNEAGDETVVWKCRYFVKVCDDHS